MGDEDHIKAAVEATGRLVFWRLAIKPGRPLAMGVIGGTPLVGLPGNPAAVYVTLLFFVRPLLAHLGGARIEPPVAQPVRAAFHGDEAPGPPRICPRERRLRRGWRDGSAQVS
jgi:molybdopterin molybdotransferase